jgi:hypothetical protein
MFSNENQKKTSSGGVPGTYARRTSIADRDKDHRLEAEQLGICIRHFILLICAR